MITSDIFQYKLLNYILHAFELNPYPEDEQELSV